VGWCVYTYRLVDDWDANQILTIEELRALRDRVGAEAAAARQAHDTAQAQPPSALAPTPLEDPAEPGQAAPHHGKHWQYPPPRRWPRRLAAAGSLALAGGLVTMLVITTHPRPDARSASRVSVPAVPPPVVSLPVVSAPMLTTTSAAPLPVPEPVSPTREAPVIPPVASSVAADGVADTTTSPRPAATVHAPRRTSRPAPAPAPAFPAPTDGRPPPTVVNLDQPAPGAAAERPGASGGAPRACGAACPGHTVNPAPTSWSPAAPQ
jgi:hypothetical protein